MDFKPLILFTFTYTLLDFNEYVKLLGGSLTCIYTLTKIITFYKQSKNNKNV